MICANCGRPITDNAKTEDGYTFCSGLCRFEWRKKGKPNPYINHNQSDDNKGITEIDNDFYINPIGFENRQLVIQPNYWGAAKIFLDGQRLRPFEKRLFSKVRKYRAVSNYGKDVIIRLKHRFLDSVPILFIDEQEFQVARPLRFWEYGWICIPLILFMGGALGGLLGGMAIFSNSILMRKIKRTFLRYLGTGITTVISFTLYLQIAGLINPHFPAFVVDAQLRQTTSIINLRCPIILDSETRLDSSGTAPGKNIIYYYTLFNKGKSEINTDEARQILTQQLIQNIQASEEMRMMRLWRVTFDYIYFDKNRNKIIEIRITPDNYS